MSSYLYITSEWLEQARHAVECNDTGTALALLRDVVTPKLRIETNDDGTVTLSNIGPHELVCCHKCIHYTHDPDPIDPGWPMMCGLHGQDMVEPYATCWWGERKE